MILLLAYALSGCAALIYEVSWTRLLSQQIGQSVWAVSTVLAAFMGGLAAGALAGGTWISRLDRPRSLRAYAALEAGIAGCALTIPIAITALTPLLSFAYDDAGGGPVFVVIRLAAALMLVGVPAAAMGATFPVAARAADAVAKRPSSSATALYASNTAGACVGATLAGFALIPRLGLSRTSWIAASLNLLAGGIALWLAAREPANMREVQPQRRPAAPARSNEQRRSQSSAATAVTNSRTRQAYVTSLAALTVTGFVALVQEVAWTRVLALTIGPTTYAFSAMLTLFILGLAVGSALGSRVFVRSRQPFLTLAAVMIVAGGAALAATPAVSRLPLRVADLVRDPAAGFWAVLRAELGMFAWLLVPLAAAFGAAFPIALRLGLNDAESAPRKAALLYAANTIGAIAGALTAGFLLIPSFGLQRTIQISGVVAIAAGCVAMAMGQGGRVIVAAGGVIVAAVCGVLAISPLWDAALLSAGAYKYASYVRGPDLESALGAGSLLYYRDGAAGSVSVRRLAGALTLSIDGKVDASNAGDMLTQKLLAHLPLMLHGKARRVLIIGLGSGVTLGSALAHPIERADTIEISHEVAEAARLFELANNHALEDPRANVIVGDGRSHLRLTSTSYDVIVSEPSNPWMAGVAALFTREFFVAARRALGSDGILCQWAHTYDISSDDLRSIVATFRSVFPDGTLWLVGQGDVLLIGSPSGVVSRLPSIELAFARPGVVADLADVGVRDASDLLAMYSAGPEELEAYAAGATVQVDDRSALEFSAPRAIVGSEEDNAGTLRTLASQFHPPALVRAARRPRNASAWRDRGKMLIKAEAHGLAYEALEQSVSMEPDDQDSVDAFVSAAAGSRRQDDAVAFLTKVAADNTTTVALRVGLSRLLATGGDTEGALAQLAEVIEAHPEDPRAWEQAAAILAEAGDADRLRPVTDRLERRWPDRASTSYFTAATAFLDGRLDDADRLAREGISRHATEARLYTLLGVSSSALHRPDAARSAFEKALALAPREPTSYTNLGIFELEAGQPQLAIRWFAEALVLDPSSPPAIRGLARALRQAGHLDRAARVEQVFRDRGAPAR